MNGFLSGLLTIGTKRSGIIVRDAPKGEELGKSEKAGLYALTQVSISRVLTSFACLSVPPIVMGGFMALNSIKSKPAIQTPLNLGMQANKTLQ